MTLKCCRGGFAVGGHSRYDIAEMAVRYLDNSPTAQLANFNDCIIQVTYDDEL